MKIRTDFVTNSSSSSFVVEMSLKTVDGESYSARVEPEIGNGMSSINIECSAESLLQYTSVNDLMDAIYNAVSVPDLWDDALYAKAYFAKDALYFAQRVKHDVKSLDQIESLTFKRIWFAWGEYSSCFGANIEAYLPELCDTAKRLCIAEQKGNDQEVEDLAMAMLFRLKYHNGEIVGPQGGAFPSGFMGSKAKCLLDIYGDEEDLIKFAHSIAHGSLDDYNDDSGIETTVIDMQNKRIFHGAVYGDCSQSGIMEDETEYKTLLKAASRCTKSQYTKLREQYLEYIRSLPYYTAEKDYFSKQFCLSDFSHEDNLLLYRSVRCWKYSNGSDYNYLIINDRIPDGDELLPEELDEKVNWLKWALFKLPQLVKEATRCNLPILKESEFLQDIQEEKNNGYPSIQNAIAAWKAKIPFDHVSEIDCSGKIIATSGLGYACDLLYKYLHIDRKILVWDPYATRNWIVERGGIIQQSLTRKCDYLIVGMGADAETEKVATAIRYRDNGKSQIKIIPKDEFLRMMNGETLEISEEDLQAMQERIDSLKNAQTQKEQLRKEAAQRVAEQKRAANEKQKQITQAQREKAAAILKELKQKQLEAKQAAIAQRQEAEKAEKEEKLRLAAQERAQKIASDVLYRPGEEPVNIRKRIDTLFEKLDGAYPDKQIVRLNTEHKKWAETAGELRKLLGYPDIRAFLESYGYTMVDAENKGGRPSNNHEAVIEELKRRYPNGGCKNASELQRNNTDLPIKTLINNAQKLFGMSLNAYLKQIGILS